MVKEFVDTLLAKCMASGEVSANHFTRLNDNMLVSILHFKGDISYSIPQLMCLTKIHTMVTTEILNRIPDGQTVQNWIAKHTTR